MDSDTDQGPNSIAIVGLAGRFPGAENVSSLWEIVKNGVDTGTSFSRTELLNAGVSEKLIDNPQFIARRCVVESADQFDADFFGYSPRDAEFMDPQHRLFLECAWEAIESAGYDPRTYDEAIGVFAGCGMNHYLLQNIVRNRRMATLMSERQLQVFSDKDFLATRVSYKLDLTGPSIDIQCACSTSLVAVHLACQSLLDFQCDMALAGGAHIQLPKVGGFIHSEGDMRSPDGRCRAFDAGANGTVFGDGVGIVALKRLEDALIDHDTIFAVIRGSALNNDGAHKVSFSAPSIEGQARVIAAAHLMADVSAESISYIEAHGTGTALGDPIEVKALTKAFRESTEKIQFCALGSIKPNIGHLDAAAGVTGLIKAALAIYHKQLPPTIHFESPNPELDIEHSPFFVNTELQEWPSDGQPRRAGVSSFGVGGTNAHVVLEEGPSREAVTGRGLWRVLPLSARTESGLERASQQLADHLEAHSGIALRDVAHTLMRGRRGFDHRRVVISRSVQDAISAFRGNVSDGVFTDHAGSLPPSRVFLFSGQGSQYVGMTKGLYNHEPAFRQVIDDCVRVLDAHVAVDLRKFIIDETDTVKAGDINQTEIAQPILFMVEFALAKLWERYGILPDAMIGHSIGEYTAACLAGVFSVEDALKLVAARGTLMQQQAGGAMVSVALPESSVIAYLDSDLEISVINGINATVVSGSPEAVQLLETRLKADGVTGIRLHTSHAFHSKLMEPAKEAFERVLRGIRFSPPQIPFLSNVTGDWITPEQATDPGYWAAHLRQPVRFLDCVRTVVEQSGRVFIEVGPGNVLTGLTRQILSNVGATEHGITDSKMVSSVRHPRQQADDIAFFLQNVGKLWAAGVEIDWPIEDDAPEPYRIPLPTYPFERRRFWIEPDAVPSAAADAIEAAPRVVRSFSETDSASQLSTADLRAPAAASDTARLVVDIWQDLLGVESLDANSDFFELGGDSVVASQVLLRVSNETGITLTLSDMFDHTTVSALAAVLAEKIEVGGSVPIPSIDRTKDQGPSPLSPGQERLWVLSRLEPDSPSFNLALAIEIKGELNTEWLAKAVNAVMRRHDPLRTTFIAAGASAKAIVHPHQDMPLPFTSPDALADGEPSVLAAIRAMTLEPFDLTVGPLIRWHLFQMTDDHHILAYSAHHIIFDGWSLGIVLDEITQAYRAFAQGTPPVLPPLEVRYSDCAVWFKQYLSERVLDSQAAYWKHQLGGFLPVMELPLDHQRPKVPDYKGALSTFSLPLPLCEKVRGLVKREGVTAFMFFLAAFKVLLYRYSGQTDVIVGTPIANRPHVDMASVVGFFVNMLPLRSDLSDNPTFSDLLASVKNTSLDAFAHQDLPFEQLVDIIQPHRDMSVHPVYQVMFAFQNFSFPPVELEETLFFNKMVDRGASQLDLWLSLWEESEVFAGSIEYSTELFDPQTVRRMIDNFITLVEAITIDPSGRIDQLAIVADAEKDRLIADFNQTQLVLPDVSSFHALFEDHAERTPERVAAVFEDRQLTYGELNGRANRLAHYLMGLGVGPDVLVGVYVERSLEMLVAVLGIGKAGGAYVPLDPTYPAERIAFMIEDARMPVIITQDALETSLPDHDAVTVCIDTDWEEIVKESGANPTSAVSADQLAYVIFTSGSTGKPKGVQVPHGAVVNFLVSMSREPGFTQDDVLLAVTTLSFDIHVLELYLPLVTGGRLVIASRNVASDGDRLLAMVNASEATVMQATPSTWRLLIAADWAASPGLKVLCGGEAFPRDLVKALLSRAGSVWNMYGPTETTVWSSCYEITDAEAPISIGRPIANTRIYILDQNLSPVPVGVAGELHIGGKGVTRGYLNRPELTASQFIADPFQTGPSARLYKTGDLARVRSDGYFEYISRIGTQVKIRGFRIELGEIESVLSDHASVAKCAASVREDRPGDARLIAYVVPEPGSTVDVSALRAHLREKLPDYMIPQHFVELTELPLTPAGKIDRKNLPSPAGQVATDAAAYVAPGNETEETLASIWQALIGIERIGIHENFFDIGGNSLLALQLINKINEIFQVKLPLRQLFDTPTIADIAAKVEQLLFEEIQSMTDEEAENLLKNGRITHERKDA